MTPAVIRFGQNTTTLVSKRPGAENRLGSFLRRAVVKASRKC